jgi:uncharacterized repeat protein (TIGR01451 family)
MAALRPIRRLLRWLVVAVVVAFVVQMAVPLAVGAQVPVIDLVVTKTDGVTTITQGGSVTYTIVVSNAGNTTSEAAIGDTLPASTFASVSWSCAPAGGATCDVDGSSGTSSIVDVVSLPAGGSVTYTVNATLDSDFLGTLTNTATALDVNGRDANEADNAATDTDEVVPPPDLAITKTDGVSTVVPGHQVTYTVTASNSSTLPVDSATVTDDLPATLIDVTWTCSPSGGASCGASGTGDISDTVALPGGSSVTYTIAGTLAEAAEGTLVNTAIVASSLTDPDPTNNVATDVDMIAALSADLSVTKSGPSTTHAGANVSYTVGVANAGPDFARQVLLADPIPTGTTFVSITQTSGPAATVTTPVAGGTGVISATWQTVAVGAAATFTVVVKVNDAAAAGDVVTNTATVSSLDDNAVETAATIDPQPNNDVATVNTTVLGTADLAIVKALAGTLVAGANATYTLTVTNHGPDAADGPIVVRDDLPPGLMFVSAGGPGWTCTEATTVVTCTHADDLANGASSTVTLVATTTAAVGTSVTNEASVAAASFDPDIGDNVDDIAGSVVAAPAVLVRTGSRVDPLSTVALALVGVGVVFASLGRRRRPHRPAHGLRRHVPAHAQLRRR